MTQQAALIHDGRGGIWRKFLLPGPGRAINAAPWLDALSRHEPVGTCHCGGYLFPGKPYTPASATRQWYPAVCATCHTDTAAAGPRPRKKGRTR